ncbi:MAG: biotin transporter BioY, partial [Candidatus Latescibacterota bacterium]
MLLGAGLFAVLTFVGANIRIPLQPVPVTLQTLFVLLAGAVLGSRVGLLSQSTYLLMGVAGLPLFAGTAVGLAVLTGPTGGYLAGFVLAPVVIGRLVNKHTSFYWHVAVFSFGSAVILLLGVLHLAVFYTRDLATALRVGCVPFLIGDALKIFAAASIYLS